MELEQNNSLKLFKIIGAGYVLHTCPFFLHNYINIMAKVTYIEHSGQKHEIEVANGLTVMEGAVQNDIPGIDADCGGGMACATCHVYVKDDWFSKLPEKENGEDDMLDQAYQPNSSSRLSCQIIISEDLNGLVVHLPEKQVY